MNENKKIITDNKPDNKQPQVPGENLRIQMCKQDIGWAINNAQLSPGVLLMIMNEFSQVLQEQNFRSIVSERKEYEESMKEGAKDGKKV